MAKPLNHLLSTAKYKNPEHTKQDILNVNKHVKSLRPRLEKYTFPTGVSKELICLDGTIPVSFRDAVYNIPIGIFISDNHPHEAPICYVRPTKDMTIKTSRHVDGSGRVYLPYLSQWNRHTSDILSTIQVMQIVFGQMCPVYQKSKSNNIATPPSPGSLHPTSSSGSGSTISMPTPTPRVTPFSSQPQIPDSTTGTISDEHIKASLLSCVQDRLKSRYREKVQGIQEEIEVLKKTSSDLERGKKQLDEMKARMSQEFVDLTKAKEKLQELDDQLKEFITKYDKEGEEVNPDEVYGPTQPLFKQLLDAFAEENAVVDAIYYTSQGLVKGVITLDVFLKSVRELSRREFMLRATIRACRAKASLPY